VPKEPKYGFFMLGVGVNPLHDFSHLRFVGDYPSKAVHLALDAGNDVKVFDNVLEFLTWGVTLNKQLGK